VGVVYTAHVWCALSKGYQDLWGIKICGEEKDIKDLWKISGFGSRGGQLFVLCGSYLYGRVLC
jgi:hypothetical protein